MKDSEVFGAGIILALFGQMMNWIPITILGIIMVGFILYTMIKGNKKEEEHEGNERRDYHK